MTALLYLAGLIIGLAAFLYIYSLYQSGKESYKELKAGKAPEPTVDSGSISYNTLKRPPGSRICPLCGSPLTKYEPLYASQVNEETGSRILIYGCNYCYKPDNENGNQLT